MLHIHAYIGTYIYVYTSDYRLSLVWSDSGVMFIHESFAFGKGHFTSASIKMCDDSLTLEF